MCMFGLEPAHIPVSRRSSASGEMALFRRKPTPYRTIVEDIVDRAVSMRVRELAGPDAGRDELASQTLDAAEAAAVIWFFTERAFRVMPEPAYRERAKEHLSSVVLDDLRSLYSEADMESRVEPLLRERVAAYHGILDASDEQGARFGRLADAIMANIGAHRLSPAQRGKAARTLYRELYLEPVRTLTLRAQDEGASW